MSYINVLINSICVTIGQKKPEVVFILKPIHFIHCKIHNIMDKTVIKNTTALYSVENYY